MQKAEKIQGEFMLLDGTTCHIIFIFTPIIYKFIGSSINALAEVLLQIQPVYYSCL